jgi:hypothetical protein
MYRKSIRNNKNETFSVLKRGFWREKMSDGWKVVVARAAFHLGPADKLS